MINTSPRYKKSVIIYMEVYRIINTINGKSYIGATIHDFKRRYRGGDWWKWTHSYHLKSAVGRYGLENFKCETLWQGKCSDAELDIKEIQYIKEYGSLIPHGYNLTKGGKREGEFLAREYELIDYLGNYYKIKNLSKFCEKNNLSYGPMLVMVAGCWPTSQGFGLLGTPIEKIRNPDRFWQLENIETGEISIIKHRGVKKWSNERGLEPSNIEQLIYGTSKTSSGWKLKETVLPENYQPSGPKYNNIKLINPQGEEITVDNVYKFCKENNIDRKEIYSLIKRKSIIRQGYYLAENKGKLEEKTTELLGKTFNFISPTGEKIEVKNLRDFCRKNNLPNQSMYALASGKTKETKKGWKIDDEK